MSDKLLIDTCKSNNRIAPSFGFCFNLHFIRKLHYDLMRIAEAHFKQLTFGFCTVTHAHELKLFLISL